MEFMHVAFNWPMAIGLVLIVAIAAYGIARAFRAEEEVPDGFAEQAPSPPIGQAPPSVVSPPRQAPPEGHNPLYIRQLERLKAALESNDLPTAYRQKARIAAGGKPVPQTVEECTAELWRAGGAP